MDPFVTVIIPVLNEARHVRACIESLLRDSYPRDRLEFVVVDGGSQDDTVAIVETLRASRPFIAIMHNTKRTQAAAFNLVMQARPVSDYFMRIDAHALYPAQFISTVMRIARLQSEPVTVYNARAVATTCFQTAVAYAQNMPLGVGASHYRLTPRSMFVEHGFHGCFRADVVRQVGGYDEQFTHNEDAELSYRLRQCGHRIWLDEALVVGYVPRDTLSGLVKQYWTYGKGRSANVIKHRVMPKPRQMAPVVLVLATPLLVALGVLVSALALLPLAIYAAVIGAVSLSAAIRRREPCLLAGVVVFPVMHYAWGAGFISKLFRVLRIRR